MIAVKYCPHCGGDAVLTANYSPKTKLWFINVKCKTCGATGKYYTQADDPDESGWNTDACVDAVEAWNRRYNPALGGDTVIITDNDTKHFM